MYNKRHAVAGFITLAALFLIARVALATEAGSVDQLTGNVTITDVDNKSRAASPKEKINAGDTVRTEAKSEVLIKLADDSTVVLRPNTQFRITDYKYEKKTSDLSIFSLLRGTARLVTGLMGKASHSSVRVQVANATIGIRGTDFEIAYVPEDTSEARAGVYDFMHEGVTNVHLATGPELDVKKEQTAFAPDKPKPGEAPLYLLDSTPLFLQSGGGLDTLLQSLTQQPVNIIHQMPMFH